MAIKVTIDPINRDIKLLVDELQSPRARSQALAEFAAEQIQEARAENRQATGGDPKYTVTVDGQKNAALSSVKADGVIFVEFEFLGDLLLFIWEQLHTHSPVGRPGESPHPGEYRRSHVMFVNGTEFSITNPLPPNVEEIIFANTVPYARRIELGSSTQAPDGVYQSVAVLARARFGRVAKVDFTYRTVMGGQSKPNQRNPAIIVRAP